MATLDLQIEKMHCGACVRQVTQALNALPFTHANRVTIGEANVTTGAGGDELVRALDSAGYPANVAHAITARA